MLLALPCANYLLCGGCLSCALHLSSSSRSQPKPPPKQSQGARTVPKVLPSAYTIKQARFTLHAVVVDKPRSTHKMPPVYVLYIYIYVHITTNIISPCKRNRCCRSSPPTRPCARGPTRCDRCVFFGVCMCVCVRHRSSPHSIRVRTDAREGPFFFHRCTATH